MKLSKIKEILPTLVNVGFQLENGTLVPEISTLPKWDKLLKTL